LLVLAQRYELVQLVLIQYRERGYRVEIQLLVRLLQSRPLNRKTLLVLMRRDVFDCFWTFRLLHSFLVLPAFLGGWWLLLLFLFFGLFSVCWKVSSEGRMVSLFLIPWKERRVYGFFVSEGGEHLLILLEVVFVHRSPVQVRVFLKWLRRRSWKWQVPALLAELISSMSLFRRFWRIPLAV